MATTIVTKKGSGAPAASDLVEGELAVDTTNGRLYTENSSAAVVELGSNPSGNITFGDNGKAIFGADGDLEIFYNGTHSVFKDGSAGNIYIQDDNNIVLGSIGGENYLVATKDDAVTLYHDAVAKIATTATGVDVSGTVTADGLTVNSGAGDLTASFQSTDQFADLKLTDSGGSSYIRQSNGSLLLQADRDNASSNSIVQVSVDGVQTARFSSGGDISFYEDTGTTAKLFWDASAESLGIGTSSPDSKLVISEGASATGLEINPLDANERIDIYGFDRGSNVYRDLRFIADEFRIETGTSSASEAMRIDSSGNVGIGTASPDYTLDLGGATPVIRIGDAGSIQPTLTRNNSTGGLTYDTTGQSITSLIEFKDNGTERMRIDSSGNLLVGKSANDATTDGIQARGIGAISIARSSVAGDALLILNKKTNDGTIAEFRKDGSTVGSIAVATDINIGSGSTRIWFRDATKSLRPISTAVGNGSDGLISIGEVSGGRFKDLYLSGKIAKGTGGELDLRSDGGGFKYKQNLDVATAGCTLTGQSTRGDMAAIRLYQTATGADGGYIRFDTCNSGSTTLTEKARLDSSGNLLVGTTDSGSAADRIQCSVTSGAKNGFTAVATTTAGGLSLVNRNSSGTYVGGVSFSNTATSFPTSSDQRLKENIVNAPSASDDIDAIQVRSFDWKADGSHQKYGMVAQELQSVAPEAVSAPEDPDEMMGVDYSKLVPMLVKEIQSLRARVAALES